MSYPINLLNHFKKLVEETTLLREEVKRAEANKTRKHHILKEIQNKESEKATIERSFITVMSYQIDAETTGEILLLGDSLAQNEVAFKEANKILKSIQEQEDETIAECIVTRGELKSEIRSLAAEARKLANDFATQEIEKEDVPELRTALVNKILESLKK